MADQVNTTAVEEKVAQVKAEVVAPAVVKTGVAVASAASKAGDGVSNQTLQKTAEVKAQVNLGYFASKELLNLIERVKASGNEVLINSIEDIRSYMVKMAPGKVVTDQAGAIEQVKLFRAIRSIIEYTEEGFQLGFVTLLRMVDENSKTVFGDMYVFRFMDNVNLSYDDRRAFERIITLIKVAAPVQGRREAVKQVNMQRALQYSLSEVGKNKITHFFDR